ncbi:MAG: hypothetical protein ACLFV7_11890 [Phycisphaerae bacterium]
MTYQPTWTNADGAGRAAGGVHVTRLCDASELAGAVNRRRRLTFQDGQDFSSHVAAGLYVRAGTFDDADAPPFDDFRTALEQNVLSPPPGSLGGTPPTPEAMQWLWADPDADEGKEIVAASPSAGQVSLFARLNGGGDWTDPTLSPALSGLRAVHVNELRAAVEALRRGRWTLPVYFAAGLFSVMPDTPWLTEAVANNGTDELRSLGFAMLRTPEGQGLTNVTVRTSSRLEITADADCTLAIARCLREVDFPGDPATWNAWDPSAGSAWQSPGGLGVTDAVEVGTLSLSADVPGSLGGAAMASALQAMVDGAPQNLLSRRVDTGGNTVGITARLGVECAQLRTGAHPHGGRERNGRGDRARRGRAFRNESLKKGATRGTVDVRFGQLRGRGDHGGDVAVGASAFARSRLSAPPGSRADHAR